MKALRGFTLLEVVVAVALFALAMALAYGGLDGVIRARDQLDGEAAQLAELQKTVLLLERDVRELLPRPVRDEAGREQPPLLLDGAHITLTRGGHGQALAQARAELVRVEWVLDRHELRRHAYQTLDGGRDEPTTGTAAPALLHVVDRLQFEALGWDARWSARWPLPGQNPEALPRAVRVVLESKAWGRIERVFELPESAP